MSSMSSTTSEDGPAARMSGGERRTIILEVARDLFGRFGYHGTTTDQIATAAGISQPYVIRIFRSKERLFLEVFQDALTTLMSAWRATLAEMRTANATPQQREDRIGEQFIDLSATRGLHTMLLQGFVSGEETEIGASARAAFLEMYRFLRDEVGMPDDRIQAFLGNGMLFSIMLAVGMPTLYRDNRDADALLNTAFGEKCGQVIELLTDRPKPRP